MAAGHAPKLIPRLYGEVLQSQLLHNGLGQHVIEQSLLQLCVLRLLLDDFLLLISHDQALQELLPAGNVNAKGTAQRNSKQDGQIIRWPDKSNGQIQNLPASWSVQSFQFQVSNIVCHSVA